jgi:hypothetical protein
MRIMKNKTPFQARGQVAYSSGGMGMSVRFTARDPDQILLLEKWLGELSGTLPFDDEAADEGLPAQSSHANGNETSYVLNELIIALLRKRVLSDGEGKTMLQKLIHERRVFLAFALFTPSQPLVRADSFCLSRCPLFAQLFQAL